MWLFRAWQTINKTFANKAVCFNFSKYRKMKGAVMIAHIVNLQQTKSFDKEKCHGGVFINYKKYDMHTISAQLVLTMKLNVIFIK